MFNNTATFVPGGVLPTPTATVPTTVFPGTSIISNSTFIIIGPPPPFPAPPRSIDLSPLKLIFAVIAIIAVPALAFALFFATPCSSGRRNFSSRSSSSSSDDPPPQVTVEISPPITPSVKTSDSGEKFQKEIGNECSVCLSVMDDGEDIQKLSVCEHAFHVPCIEKWLTNNPNCPICRAEVPVKLTEAANATVNRSGGNRRVSATTRDDDWRHGLPDASSLV